jgi:integration host factor subunit beta
VELRYGFSLKPQIQKARMSRNPRTNEKVFTKEKKTILFKISKEWAKKINEKI